MLVFDPGSFRPAKGYRQKCAAIRMNCRMELFRIDFSQTESERVYRRDAALYCRTSLRWDIARGVPPTGRFSIPPSGWMIPKKKTDPFLWRIGCNAEKICAVTGFGRRRMAVPEPDCGNCRPSICGRQPATNKNKALQTEAERSICTAAPTGKTIKAKAAMRACYDASFQRSDGCSPNHVR